MANARSIECVREAADTCLHGLLEHDVAEDELHEVLGGRLQCAVQVLWCSPAPFTWSYLCTVTIKQVWNLMKQAKCRAHVTTNVAEPV